MWALAAVLLLLQTPDYNEEGRKALEAQKYEEAAQAFSKVLQADPKDFTAEFHLALAQSMLKRDQEAIAGYKKVLELKPGLYQAQLNLGILLIRQNQGAEAATYLQPAVDAKPKEFRPRYYLGEALLSARDFPKAEEQFRTALELDPKQGVAELGLAHAQARQNRLADADPHFRKAAELDPGLRDSLLELGELYEKNKQIPEAIAIYQMFPQNVGAQERMGQLMLENKRYGEAIPRLEEAFGKDPTPANRLALAEAYLFNKQLDKALPLLQQNVVADPHNFDLRMILARALRDGKQYPAAAQQFYEAVKLKPDARQAWNDLASMLYLTQNYPQAIQALDRSLQLGENTPGNHYLRAIILDKMRDLKPALESYRRFLELSQGKNPDEEFKARQRARIIEKELSKR